MVSCSTEFSTIALSILKHATLPTESFVFSPYSLNTILSIARDGACGQTEQELNKICYDSSEMVITHSISLSEEVQFKSVNRVYVNETIQLNDKYKEHIQDRYMAKVENINMRDAEGAAKSMNEFVESETGGDIKNLVQPSSIHEETKAFLINAASFIGRWAAPFFGRENRQFYGLNEEKQMEFMKTEGRYLINRTNEFGTVLITPYAVPYYETAIDNYNVRDEDCSFFYFMPEQSSDLTHLINKLTGADLAHVLKNCVKEEVEIIVPEFKIKSKLNAIEVLSKMGVHKMFCTDADFSKISPSPLFVSQIQHNTVFETDEQGTKASTATVLECMLGACLSDDDDDVLPSIVIDRSFLFGIIKSDEILFIGKFV